MAPAYDRANSLQDALLADVRALTAGHGTKKALAEHLGMHPTRLSEYLAEPPVKRPNGEMTLKLQAWVTAQKEKHPKA